VAPPSPHPYELGHSSLTKVTREEVDSGSCSLPYSTARSASSHNRRVDTLRKRVNPCGCTQQRQSSPGNKRSAPVALS